MPLRDPLRAVRRGLAVACVLIAAAGAAGCSTKAWYGGLQLAAQNECRRQPPGDTEGCLARLNTLSYEAYERKRSGANP
jgi:hypothetical protein